MQDVCPRCNLKKQPVLNFILRLPGIAQMSEFYHFPIFPASALCDKSTSTNVLHLSSSAFLRAVSTYNVGIKASGETLAGKQKEKADKTEGDARQLLFPSVLF